jgi:predicted N-acyltransferase
LQDDAGQLQAATPLYLKSHSYGEYVFDWAWADAYLRNNLAYYPKLLSAIPFTPVFGERLLAADAAARAALCDTLVAFAQSASQDDSLLGVQISSLHGLFYSQPGANTLRAQGLLQRCAVQFHWHNRSPEGYGDFPEFLGVLSQKKRKNILAERRKVRDSGIAVHAVEGPDMTAAQWAFFYQCYSNTYLAHQSSPYLTPAFFEELARDMPEQVVVFMAMRGDQPVACSFCLVSDTTLYGRYWGAAEHIACLHFETAYYAPLEWAISKGLKSFEGGAQGEHKMSRGFEPVAAQSVHWLAHPGFADAVERYLNRESAGISAYMSELEAHSPFRQTD